MKKVALLSILAALICSAAFFTRAQAFSPKGNPLAASRQDSDEAFACSNETLEGTYGLNISGTRPVPAMSGTIEQLVGVGTRTFDGDGNFSQVTNEKGSVKSIVASPQPVMVTTSGRKLR